MKPNSQNITVKNKIAKSWMKEHDIHSQQRYTGKIYTMLYGLKIATCSKNIENSMSDSAEH